MCTVTIVQLTDAGERRRIRLACNRDELRSRALARPPELRACGVHRALMPVDPASDGTWIAVNDALVAASLLNVNAGDRGPADGGRPPRSRGAIVPEMMRFDCARDAADAITNVEPRDYSPFRVVVVDSRAVFEVRSDGQSIEVAEIDQADRPLFFTSSGLGDALVEAPRRALFDEWFGDLGESGNADRRIALQDSFHRHQWPERTALSVCMSRADARTVSYTVIEIDSHGATMSYQGDSPDRPVAPVRESLAARRTT